MAKLLLILILLSIPFTICKSQTVEDQSTIWYMSDPPSFNGGDLTQFLIWVYSNIKYPDTAIKDSLSGKVIARFYIDKLGSVDSVEIIKSSRYDIDNEVKRVIESSPKWTPAKANGDPIATFLYIPVEFLIKDKEFKDQIKKFSKAERKMFKKHFR